ncbi:hypothetical protein BGZ47_009785 [Haplosporangium gracile]|nr:hypothetical protein BGZ47_009785 [Haplosporangium gracile]
MTKNDPNPEVFTNHYFRHGLRFDPKYDCRVVFLSDVDQTWIHLNIVPKYRASYLRRSVESLLYLRTFTLAEREEHLFHAPSSSKKKRQRNQGLSHDSVPVSINYKNGSVRLRDGPSLPPHEDQNKKDSGPFPISQQETSDREMRRLLRAHKVVPGPDRNIDQDLWRLYDLWELFLSNEKDDDEDTEKPCSLTNQADEKGGSRQFVLTALLPNPNSDQALKQTSTFVNSKWNKIPFPARPQILIDDVHYLRTLESVRVFDLYNPRSNHVVPLHLPIVKLQSRSQDISDSNNSSSNMRSVSAAVAAVPGPTVTHPGPTPEPTLPIHRHQRRHHRRRRHQNDDNDNENQSHSHRRRHHRYRRHKCALLTAILGRECNECQRQKKNLHLEEEKGEASSEQEEEALIKKEPFTPAGLAARAASASLHASAPSTTTTTTTTTTPTVTVITVNAPVNNHISPPVSLEAAYAL